MNKGLVSIVMPCYNGETYIDDCLNALLNQTYKNLEIIIINDGSTDNSLEKLQSYQKIFKKNKMIYKVLNQSNQGQASAVNNGLKEITGEFLVWQDIDDIIPPNGIKSRVDFLSQNKNFNLVRGEVEYRDDELKKNLGYGKSKNPSNQNIFDNYIFETDSYCFPGIIMVRMKHFDERVKNREIYTPRAGQNWQLILPISYKERCGYLNEVVYVYRIVDNSHSHRVKTKKDLLKRCNEHKDILFKVIKTIPMKKSIRFLYKIRIAFKYLKKKIRIII